jgi:hypothetical protein
MTPDEAGAIIDALGETFRLGNVEAAAGQFASRGEVIYAGSERGEVALGLTGVRSLLTDVFAREERYSWRCNTVHVAPCAAGFAVLADATLFVHPYPDADADNHVGTERESHPYRVSGLLENEDGKWRWRFCQGAEPAPPSTT